MIFENEKVSEYDKVSVCLVSDPLSLLSKTVFRNSVSLIPKVHL